MLPPCNTRELPISGQDISPKVVRILGLQQGERHTFEDELARCLPSSLAAYDTKMVYEDEEGPFAGFAVTKDN